MVLGDVEGLMTAKVKVKGKTATTKSYEQMLFVFNPNGTFNLSKDTTNILGTWKQKKNNFNVYFSLSNVQPYFDSVENEIYAEQGLTVNIYATSVVLKGKENKDGTIKGTLTAKATVYYIDYNMKGNMSISYPFTGTQQVSSMSSVNQQDNIYFEESASFPDLLTDVIAETIIDAIDDSE